MTEDTVYRHEHEEFARRIDEENERQNKRLAILEDSVKQIGELTQSVNRLAVNMDNMLKELTKQGTRLETLENRDGEKWRKVAGYVATTVIGLIIGAVAGAIFKSIGL